MKHNRLGQSKPMRKNKQDREETKEKHRKHNKC